MISLEKNTKLPNGYSVLHRLGCGNFGTTFKCTHTDGVACAKVTKILTKKKGVKDGYLSWETNLLRNFKHENIVTLLEPKYYNYQNARIMYIELLEPIEIHIANIDCKTIGNHISNALTYIHKKKHVHRDVKPENVMIRPTTLSAVLCDFGTCTTFKDYCGNLKTGEGRTGSAIYMSPSVHQNNFTMPNDDMISLILSIGHIDNRIKWSKTDEEAEEMIEQSPNLESCRTLDKWKNQFVPLFAFLRFDQTKIKQRCSEICLMTDKDKINAYHETLYKCANAFLVDDVNQDLSAFMYPIKAHNKK